MAEANGYCHLHVHSTYSLLDGAARIGALFAEAERLGMPALAITDHGNLFGVAEFYRRSLRSPVKPIVGMEAYVAPASRHHKKPVYWGHPGQRGDDVSGGGAYTHMTLLARNATGLRNLFRLSSLASMEGFYQKARVDKELLAKHSEGIIATTGCPSGEVQTRLRLGQPEQALQAAADYRDVFGTDNFYLELMDHGLTLERNVREGLLEIGRKLGLRPLATNDSHYVTSDQAGAHDVLLCVQTGKKVADANRFRFEGTGYYLKSAAEMRGYWDGEVPGACDNTLRIAEQVEGYAEVFASVDRKPHVALAPGDTEDAVLRREVGRGVAQRFPSGMPEVYRERLDTELGIVSRMGFCGYFLVVTDLVRWAAAKGIMCRARGSSAGSLVAYLLDITDIDPIVHGLYFERFINPDRVSPPDIDIDIDDRYRAAASEYLTTTYGADKIAQVVTFGTIKTRAAITDATRVLDHPISLGEKIKKALPRPVYAQDIPLSGVFDPGHERYAEAATVRLMAEEDSRAAEILTVARGLEGLVRNTGVHACGVFLSSVPLIDVIPLWARPADGAIVTGWEWSDCEDVGLLKMDLLGSATIRAIVDTLAAVKSNHGVTIDLATLPLDDPATYELLAGGSTQGVFQFEESGAADTLRRVAPTCFADICAATALYRPGPMEMGAHREYADRKNGRAPVTPIHPELAEPLSDVLSGTYGLCVSGDTTLVNATTGRRTRINEIGDSVASGEFKVFGIDRRGDTVARRVTRWWRSSAKPSLRITTKDGRSVRVSPDHRILTLRGWVTADNLVANVDYVAHPRSAQQFEAPDKISGDAAAFMGYLIAEGYVTLYANTFTSADATLRRHVMALCRELFPDVHPIEEIYDYSVPRIRFGAAPAGSGRGSRIGYGLVKGLSINRWLRDMGYTEKTTSAHKFVPTPIKRSSVNSRLRFLAALWDTDGHTGKNSAFYKSISRELVLGIRDVLFSLGIPGVLRTDPPYESAKGTRTPHSVYVYDDRFWEMIVPLMTVEAKKPVRSPRSSSSRSRGLNRALMLANATEIISADRECPPRTRRKVQSSGATIANIHNYLWGKGLLSARATSHGINDGSGRYPLSATATAYLADMGTDEDVLYAEQYWSRVIDVADSGMEVMYDITVEDIHNFLGNNIVLSNCTYQEDVMAIARKVAGYTLGQADLLRRAMGKKKKEILDSEYVRFRDGMAANGYSAEATAALWNTILPFSSYGFVRSHAASYGLQSYWTAYLKAHYPAEFMAARLSSVAGDKARVAIYLGECRRLGIAVLPPCVNASGLDFTAAPEGIRFGLGAVRNVGEGAVRAITDARGDTAFVSLADFLGRVDLGRCNKRALEALVKAGALDTFGHPRRALLEALPAAVDAALVGQHRAEMGQGSLFGDDPAAAEVAISGPEWPPSEMLGYEREMLGRCVSAHPLDGVERALRRHAPRSVGELLAETPTEGERVAVAGIIAAVEPKQSKAGRPWAVVTVEDATGQVEVRVLGKAYAAFGALLARDAVVAVTGTVGDGESLRILGETVTVIDPAKPDAEPPQNAEPPEPEPFRLVLALADCTAPRIEGLREVFGRHPGDRELRIRLVGRKRAVDLASDTLRVGSGAELAGDVRNLLWRTAAYASMDEMGMT